MNYQEALDYMYSQLPMYQRIGAAAYKADLTKTIAICELTDHPYRNFKSVHVGGTNGKGSVSHMLASIMQENGLKTGLYTSPHLRDFRERIKINGEMIAKDFVASFVEKYQADFDTIKPSFFEMTFSMAMDWFSHNKVDIAIVEVGMGGRLDSTNVITPLISVITNIGLDHVQFLGHTISGIAREKAGIIKQEVPVVIGETLPDTVDVFINKAKELRAPLIIADRIVKVIKDGRHPDENNMSVMAFHDGHKTRLVCPLLGDYQLKNLATVIATTDLLKTTYTEFEGLQVFEGIKNTVSNTGLLGRWQILNKQPLTICDIGHNADGMAAVVNQIGTLEFSNLHFVLGMVNDKDVDKILAKLPMNAKYYFCKADIPRGLEAKELKMKALDYELFGEVYRSVKSAYKAAREAAGKDDLIFIGGSAFVVAEVV